MKKFSIFLIALSFALSVIVVSNSYADKNKVAIDGYCPVCVSQGMPMKGNHKFVTEYRGKLYMFAGFKQQKMFFNNPESYVDRLDAKYKQLMGNSKGSMQEGSHQKEEGSHQQEEGSH